MAKVAQEKKVKAIQSVADKAIEKRKTTLRTIKSPLNESRTLCQCMCDLEVTSQEMLEAMKYIVSNRRQNSATTTTTASPSTAFEIPDW